MLGPVSLLDDTQRPLPEVTIEEALEHLPQTPNRIVPSGFLQMYMNGIWYFWYLIRLQTVIEPASLSARISSFTGEAIISQLGFFCRYGYCDNIRNYWTRWKSLRLISDVVLKAGIRSLTFKGFSPTLTIYPLVDYMCRIAFDDLNIYNILKAKKGYSVEDLDCLAASRIRDLFEALNDENFYLGLSSCLAQIRRPDAVKLFVECYKERFSENWKLGCNPRWNNAAKGSVQTVKESDVHRSYKEGLVKIFIRSLCRIKISGNYPNMNSNQVDFDILNQNVRLLAYFEFFTFLVQVNLKCTYPSRIVDNDMLELIDAEFIQEFDAVMDVSKALTHDMLVRVEKNEEPARDSATAEQIVVLKMPRESQLEFLKACLLKLDELSNASREYKENVIKIAPNKCPVVSKYRKFLQLQGKLKDAEAKAKEGK